MLRSICSLGLLKSMIKNVSKVTVIVSGIARGFKTRGIKRQGLIPICFGMEKGRTVKKYGQIICKQGNHIRNQDTSIPIAMLTCTVLRDPCK
jgi:hypothetical protein